jgi:hypothetical protein
VAVTAYAISLTLAIRRARFGTALAVVAGHVDGALRVARARRRLAAARAHEARTTILIGRAPRASSVTVTVDAHGSGVAGIRAVPVDLAGSVLVAAKEVIRRLAVWTDDHASRLLSAVGVHTTWAHARRSRAGSRARTARAPGAPRTTRGSRPAAGSSRAAAGPSVAARRGSRAAASARVRADEEGTCNDSKEYPHVVDHRRPHGGCPSTSRTRRNPAFSLSLDVSRRAKRLVRLRRRKAMHQGRAALHAAVRRLHWFEVASCDTAGSYVPKNPGSIATTRIVRGSTTTLVG